MSERRHTARAAAPRSQADATAPCRAPAGIDSAAVWESICGAIVKSLLAVRPALAQAYAQTAPRPAFAEDAADAPFRCFELLGYDFMLDSAGKPWLIEVNHSPSFGTDTAVDRAVKEALIADTLRLARLDPRSLARAHSVRGLRVLGALIQ